MGSMVFTVMAALAQMELEIKRERSTDSVAKRRAAGKDLGGRRQALTDSQIRIAVRLIESGEPASQVARDLGMSRATLYRRIRELPTAVSVAAPVVSLGRGSVDFAQGAVGDVVDESAHAVLVRDEGVGGDPCHRLADVVVGIGEGLR
jgi:predicted DNA-binding transcriptional regulator AlpA